MSSKPEDPFSKGGHLWPAFRSLTGRDPAGIYRAPGRVNLIGEHTDYNDGFVLPIGIGREALVAGAPTNGRVLRVWSLQRSGEPERVVLDQLDPGSVRGWAAYAAGPAWALQQRGQMLAGVDIVIDSEVPIGAGLSSSAALEVAVTFALTRLNEIDAELMSVAELAHAAEHDFVGVPCGVMDQMASALATEGHALLIDTRTSEIEQIAFSPPPEAALMVIDTRASHRLADSAYSDRRAACEQAAATLGIKALRDLSVGDLSEAAERLPAEVLPLVRHVVTENARVISAVAALRSRDWTAFGAEMNASHESLRTDFKVSSPELDLAAEVSKDYGALGARMTGAGFGGSAIALMPAGRKDELSLAVQSAFQKAGMTEPNIFETQAVGGCSQVWPAM